MTVVRSPFHSFPRPVAVVLTMLLLAALGLRLYALNWDQGHDLHPDELFIAKLVLVGRIHLAWPPDFDQLRDPAISGLNPRSVEPGTDRYREFAYGALPLFVTDLAAELVSRLTGVNWHLGDRVYLVGRFISALLDSCTILVVYAIGARVASRRVGILAALFAALTPMSIQLAHFFTTDSWLTFFVALCLLCSVRAAERGQFRWFAAAGATFGLAMATKGSVFTLAGVIGAAAVYDIWRRRNAGEPPLIAFAAAPERLALASVTALCAFALFEPYALLKPDVYLHSLQRQVEIVRGIFDVPFTRQYVGTTPVLYQIEQLLLWGLGPVIGVLAFAGVGLGAVRFLRRPVPGLWILLTWFLGYGTVVAIPETKFLRYLAPLVPVLTVMAGLALDTCWRTIARYHSRRLALGAVTLILTGVAVWTAAFQSIYAHEHTRLAASRWIFANIPNGASLSSEYWDDALPKNLGPGLDARDRQYDLITMDLYGDRPTRADLQALADAFRAIAPTQGVAAAVDQQDYPRAADLLRNLSANSSVLSRENRETLADRLDRAAAAMSGPAHQLVRACRDAAAALRDDPPTRDLGMPSLADALVRSGANETSNYLYTTLERLDYVIISSNRVIDSLRRSPWRYPVQIHYYDLLSEGKLGFELAAIFEQPPSLGPFRFDDRGADESFINYDHPRVLIFRKVAPISRAEYDALMASAIAQPVSPTRHPPKSLLLDRPVGELPVVADGRWSESITRHSLAALGFWLILLVALQIAGGPFAALIFGEFADRGWGVARLVALVVAAYPVWLAASLQWMSFRAIWCISSLLVLALVSWVGRRRWRRPSIKSIGRRQHSTVIGAEMTFWLVFALFLLFRFLNPDGWHPIWGGEKPMEFAHLNATLRSAHFPPYDPWYAGGYINYYYYGLYLVAFCLKVTGIPAEIGFNLAQPTIMALLASAGFSVAATLGRDLARSRSIAPVAGGLGALMLVGIGNLTTLGRLLHSPRPPLDDFGAWTWSGSRAIANAITEFPYFTGLYADLHAHVVALPLTVLAIALCYAIARSPRRLLVALSSRRAARARFVLMANLGLLTLVIGTLTVTNVWDVPVYVALAASSILMATSNVREVGRRALVTIGLVLSLVVGGYALFLPFHRHSVAIFSSLARVREPTPFDEFGSHLGGLLAIVLMGLIVVSLVHTISPVAWLPSPLLAVGAIVTLLLVQRLIAAVRPELARSFFVAIIVIAGGVGAVSAWHAGMGPPGFGHARWHWLPRLGLCGGVIFAFALLIRGELVLAACLALLAIATAIWLTGVSSATRFTALLVAAAAGIGAGVEIVVVADDLIGGDAYRMNTIFKFYNQIWVILALAGASLLGGMITIARLPWPRFQGVKANQAAQPSQVATAASHAAAVSSLALQRGWARVGLAISAIIIAGSLLYPLLATSPRLDQRFTPAPGFGTLNALDWMFDARLPTVDRDKVGEIAFADDRAVIDWFNRNIDGSPVIAEATIGPYRCNGSRISNATGLPTIIGWERHEHQQRYAVTLRQRTDDVARLYYSTDPVEKEEILHRYGVEYVIVGDLERAYPIADNSCAPTGSPAGIAAFARMVGSVLDVAFVAGNTTVYQVRPVSPAKDV